MVYAKTLMLAILAALPFILSYLLKQKKHDLEQRHTFFRCFHYLCIFITKHKPFSYLSLFLNKFNSLFPNSKNSRKLFLLIAFQLIILYHFIDYSYYISDTVDTFIINENHYATHHILDILPTFVPIQYFMSILITLPLIIYPVGNAFLLLIHNCDDRLFLFINFINLYFIYDLQLNVFNMTIYILLLAATFYKNELYNFIPKLKHHIPKCLEKTNSLHNQFNAAA